MTQHYLAAQKAIDGLRMSFKSSKKPKSDIVKLHPSDRHNVACDCCAAPTPHNHITAIDSGQRLCQACLVELRG